MNKGWALVKDIHCRNLRWTVTDTCLSPNQNFLLYTSITPTVHMVGFSAHLFSLGHFSRLLTCSEGLAVHWISS